jgi:lipopolysaccharide transport system permease protein
MVNELRICWNKRYLIYDLALRELQLRFQGSLMGKYWNILHPVIVVIIYTLIFSRILGIRSNQADSGSGMTYAAFLCAGLLPWNFFTELMQRGTGSFHEFAHLIKKISFPILIPHLSMGLSICITFCISIAVYFCFLIATQSQHLSNIVFLPFIVVLQAFFTLGLAMILGVVNVFFKDVQQLLSIGLQLLFWATPIVYSAEAVPQKYKWISELNPMSHFVELYRFVFLGSNLPTKSCVILCIATPVIIFLGILGITRSKSNILDQI